MGQLLNSSASYLMRMNISAIRVDQDCEAKAFAENW